MLGVDPVSDAIGHALPFLNIFPHRLPAQSIEFGDTEFLDVLLAFRADLLLDLELYRQPMRIPASLAQDVLALHGLVARDQVLESAREHVMQTRATVRRRRPFKEDIALVLLAQLHGLLEGVVLLPELQDLFFEVWELYLR